MADPSATLRAHIRKVRTLATLTDRVAPKAAAAVRREIVSSIERGESPDGTPLKPTKDGRQPLKNAGRAVVVRPVGKAIVAAVKGHHARHDKGWVRGGKGGSLERPLLPRDGIPKPIAEALTEVVIDEAEKIMGGT